MSKPLLVIGNKNYSTWSLRAWIGLRKAGVDFEERRIPLDTPEFEREIGAYSPTRRVPVLRLGELVIWDSLAICEFANERFAAGRLWPLDEESRGVARAGVSEMHSGFELLRHALPMNLRARDRRVARSPELETEIARMREIWAQAKGRYGDGGPWLFGAFSIADAFFIPVVFRFLTYGVELGELEREYAETVQGDADVQSWLEAARAETEVVAADEAGEPEA